MDKPDDIPQDVWSEAWGAEAWARPHYTSATTDSEKLLVVESIARAILAERERCVKVVEEQVPAWVKGRDGEYWEGYREAIADALDDLRIPAGAREGAAD